MRSDFDKEIERVVLDMEKKLGVSHMEALQATCFFGAISSFTEYEETYKDADEAVSKMFKEIETFPNGDKETLDAIKAMATNITLTIGLEDKMTAPLLAVSFMGILEHLKGAEDMEKLRAENKNLRATMTSLMEALRKDSND